MKQVLHVIFYCITGVLLLTGCDKKDGAALLNMEDSFNSGPINAQIEEYIRTHNIDAERDPSGLYYHIYNMGDSVHYMLSLDNIPYVRYSRRLITGELIDFSPNATNFNGRPLKDHIAGWQIGLQKIAKGGKILLIIPPSLGFGSIAIDKIPANSILVCELTLVDFK